MIRVKLTRTKRAYGYDVTDWIDRPSEYGIIANLLTEDLVDRIRWGDIIMYCENSETAEEWCNDNGYIFEDVTEKYPKILTKKYQS